MSSRSVWLNQGQLEAFVLSRQGRTQTATELWRLITTRFSNEIREVYQQDILTFRQGANGEIEVSLDSMRLAMEFLDPCWIRDYGQRQHRWLNDWLATFD